MQTAAPIVKPEIVEKTWNELGYRVKAQRNIVIVRTLPFEERTHGGLWLPPKLAGFHGGLGHQRVVKAVVLDAGKWATVKTSEVICFTRLYFAYWKRLEDGSYFGWIDNNQIAGYPEE